MVGLADSQLAGTIDVEHLEHLDDTASRRSAHIRPRNRRLVGRDVPDPPAAPTGCLARRRSRHPTRGRRCVGAARLAVDHRGARAGLELGALPVVRGCPSLVVPSPKRTEPPRGRNDMNDYPAMIARVNHVEPVPRRIRARLAGETVVDTTRALYVWEWPNYPQYYIPLDDVTRGRARRRRAHPPDARTAQSACTALQVGDVRRAQRRAGRDRLIGRGADGHGPLRLGRRWTAGSRRTSRSSSTPATPTPGSTRSGRRRRSGSSWTGVVLAESASPVMVFETGLPTRYYLNRTEVNFEHLLPTDTVTACPYKGTTSGYWSVRIGDDRARGPGLGLRLPDPAALADRRNGRLLQREGRRLPRRQTPRTAQDPFLPLGCPSTR